MTHAVHCIGHRGPLSIEIKGLISFIIIILENIYRKKQHGFCKKNWHNQHTIVFSDVQLYKNHNPEDTAAIVKGPV